MVFSLVRVFLATFLILRDLEASLAQPPLVASALLAQLLEQDEEILLLAVGVLLGLERLAQLLLERRDRVAERGELARDGRALLLALDLVRAQHVAQLVNLLGLRRERRAQSGEHVRVDALERPRHLRAGVRVDEDGALNRDCGRRSVSDRQSGYRHKLHTVIGLEELDEGKVEPEPVFFTQVVGDRVILVDELEDVGPDVAEARVLAEAEDARYELVWPNPRLEDRVQRLARDGTRLAVVLIADAEEEGAQPLDERVDAGGLGNRLYEL